MQGEASEVRVGGCLQNTEQLLLEGPRQEGNRRRASCTRDLSLVWSGVRSGSGLVWNELERSPVGCS